MLAKYKKGRAMLLTTHFMDEADLLSDSIAIMAGGQLKCWGTPLSLKQQYASGWGSTSCPTVMQSERGERAMSELAWSDSIHLMDGAMVWQRVQHALLSVFIFLWQCVQWRCRYTLTLNMCLESGRPADRQAITELVSSTVAGATLLRTSGAETVRPMHFILL